jgi:hypothetical protein
MRNMMLVMALLGLGLVPTGPAAAHAFLKAAVPAVGTTVTEGPHELRLRFSEGVEAAFSGVTLTTGDDQRVQPVTVAVDPADSTILVVTLTAPLAPGLYKVQWHVVSVDTHKTQGRYDFTVTP